MSRSATNRAGRECRFVLPDKSRCRRLDTWRGHGSHAPECRVPPDLHHPFEKARHYARKSLKRTSVWMDAKVHEWLLSHGGIARGIDAIVKREMLYEKTLRNDLPPDVPQQPLTTVPAANEGTEEDFRL